MEAQTSTNSTPQSCEDSYMYPGWIHSVIPPYIYTISALGIPLNLLVLLVFLLHKKPCTATEIYLSNMAAADLFLVIFLPFWGVYVSSKYTWTFGGPMCKIVCLLLALNYNCSIYFLILVCLDRYLALVHPLLQCKLRRRKYAKLSCLAVWVFSLILNTPTLVCRQTSYNSSGYPEHTCVWNCSVNMFLANDIIQAVAAFIIPLLIISFCTVKILQALKARPKEGINNQNQTGERKVTILVLAVLVAFLICWLPMRIQKIVELCIRFELIEEGCTLVRVVQICQHILLYFGFFNSDLNPVLYVIVGKNFRKKMCEVLKGGHSVRKSSTQFGTTLTTSSVLSSQKHQLNTKVV